MYDEVETKYGVTQGRLLGPLLLNLYVDMLRVIDNCFINMFADDTIMETKYGVPQGTVLGPLLLNFYVNGMPRVIDNCFINMFADDTMIYVVSCNMNLMVDQ